MELNNVAQGDPISASQWNEIIARIKKEGLFSQKNYIKDRKFGIITASIAAGVAWKYTFEFIKKTKLAYTASGFVSEHDGVTDVSLIYYAYNFAEYPLTSAYVPVPNGTIVEVIEFAADTGGTDADWEWWFNFWPQPGNADYQVLSWDSAQGNYYPGPVRAI